MYIYIYIGTIVTTSSQSDIKSINANTCTCMNEIYYWGLIFNMELYNYLKIVKILKMFNCVEYSLVHLKIIKFSTVNKYIGRCTVNFKAINELCGEVYSVRNIKIPIMDVNYVKGK